MWKKALLNKKRKIRGGGVGIKGKYIFYWSENIFNSTDYALFKFSASTYFLSIQNNVNTLITSKNSLLPNYDASPDSIPKLLSEDLHSAKQMSSVFCQCWTTSHPVFQFVSRLNRAKKQKCFL